MELQFPLTEQSTVGSCRRGTCFAEEKELRHLFGIPNISDNGDGAVSLGWRFLTPRGPAALRDYWSNAPGEWSIAAASAKAALWMRKMLRQQGLCVPFQYHVNS